jgi:hypothetical protein
MVERLLRDLVLSSLAEAMAAAGRVVVDLMVEEAEVQQAMI